MAIVDPAGVTARETNVAPVTVRDAVPLTDPEVAVMVLVPEPTPVTTPSASTVAVASVVLDHVKFVSNCVLPSSKLPTALNCNVVPAATDCTAGLTAIEVRWAATTVRVEESVSAPRVAVIFVVPAATVVITPDAVTVATEGVEEVQVTPLDKSELLPSL
jgi:hypothetical protein